MIGLRVKMKEETSQPKGQQKRHFRLGVSPLGWSNDVLPELGGDIPLEVFLREAAEIGYEGVELGRKFPRQSQQLLPLLSRYGLKLVSGWHSGMLAERSVEEEWKAAANHIDLLKECGCDLLIYGECGLLTSDSPWDTHLSLSPKLESIDLPRYAAKMNEFARRLGHRGLKLAYHYHLKMLVENAEEITAFFGATSDEVGVLLDTGHAFAAGADYGEVIRRFGNRIVHIHLKDVRDVVLRRARADDVSFNTAVREGIFAVPGEGDVDFLAVAEFLRSSGYRGWLIVEAEQDPAKAPPKQNAKRAFQYVQSMVG
jgi:inosose dehydratase